MRKHSVKHLFPGGNTPQGFFSYYDNIISQKEAKRIFIIKGGPGVGKSSLMKKIANEMLQSGYDVEMLHCSSDPDSLDGVVIPGINVAIIDGTAPHIVDPRNPGAVDEIIHLGDYWEESAIISNKPYIIKCNEEIGSLFKRAYRYLSASMFFYEDIESIYDLEINKSILDRIGSQIFLELFGDSLPENSRGKIRKMFVSAITPKGIINYIDYAVKGRIFAFKVPVGFNVCEIMNYIVSEAVKRGFYVEAFCSLLRPWEIEHAVINGLDVSIVTSNSYHSTSLPVYKEIDFVDIMQEVLKDEYLSEVITYNAGKFDELVNKAVETIKQAKRLHDELETYYTPHMDFEAVDRCMENLLCKLDYCLN